MFWLQLYSSWCVISESVPHGSRGIDVCCTSCFVCLQVEGSQSSWIQTLWTLFMNMDKPKHMPWYRWCKIIWMQHQLHKIALPRGEGQELHQVLHTFKILLYYWGYTVFTLICNKNSPFQKINIWKVQFFSELCVFLCAYVCVACLSDGLPKMLPSSNTHVLQTWSVAVKMCCFSLRRTWPQSIHSLLVGSGNVNSCVHI